MSVSALFQVPQQHYLLPYPRVGHNYIVFVSILCYIVFFDLFLKRSVFLCEAFFVRRRPN